MKNIRAKQPVRPQVLEEAAGWLVEFRAGSPNSTERSGFDAWLRASPEHVRAYLTLLPVWEDKNFGDLPAQSDPDTLIQWARAADDNIVPLSSLSRQSPGAEARHSSRRAFAIAATVLMVIGAAGYFAFSAWKTPVYATDTGEQTTIALPDGTLVSLNARTRIQLRYSDRERRVELRQGQALFQVFKDAARPFIVSSDAAQVRALGTEFDIYKKSTGTVVTVVEGKVAVEGEGYSSSAACDRGAGEGCQVILTPGQQLTLDRRQKFTAPAKIDPKIATAWTQRRLIFSAAPLTEVAEEFNRYNRRQLVIDDVPELKSFRINGVFSSANPAGLLGFLREQPGIVIAESDREIHVAQK